MDGDLTVITDVITAASATLMTVAVLFLVRWIHGMVQTVEAVRPLIADLHRVVDTMKEMKVFMDEDRVEHRKNLADHDLFATHLGIEPEAIVESRRKAGVNGGDTRRLRPRGG